MLRRLLTFLVSLAMLAGATGLAARLLLKSRGGPQSDEVDLVAVFEGIHLRSTAQSFLGGKILALFGGVVLDLRRAQLGPTGAELIVTTVFGGTSVVVPTDWRVEVDDRTWLGGLDLSGEQPGDPDAPVLRIRVSTLLGGFQVESRPRLQAVS